jgi:hypothetical protein
MLLPDGCGPIVDEEGDDGDVKARVHDGLAHDESARSSSRRGNTDGGDVGDREEDGRRRLPGSPPLSS